MGAHTHVISYLAFEVLHHRVKRALDLAVVKAKGDWIDGPGPLPKPSKTRGSPCAPSTWSPTGTTEHTPKLRLQPNNLRHVSGVWRAGTSGQRVEGVMVVSIVTAESQILSREFGKRWSKSSMDSQSINSDNDYSRKHMFLAAA